MDDNSASSASASREETPSPEKTNRETTPQLSKSVSTVEISERMDFTFGDFDQPIRPQTTQSVAIFGEGGGKRSTGKTRTWCQHTESSRSLTSLLDCGNASQQKIKTSGDMNGREDRGGRLKEDTHHRIVSSPQSSSRLNHAAEKSQAGFKDRGAVHRKQVKKGKEFDRPARKQKAGGMDKVSTASKWMEDGANHPPLTEQSGANDTHAMSSARANPRNRAKVSQRSIREEKGTWRGRCFESSAPQYTEFLARKGAWKRHDRNEADSPWNRQPSLEELEHRSSQSDACDDGPSFYSKVDTRQAYSKCPPTRTGVGKGSGGRGTSSRPQPSQTGNDPTQKSGIERHSEPRSSSPHNDGDGASGFWHQDETDRYTDTVSRSKYRSKTHSTPTSRNHQTGEERTTHICTNLHAHKQTERVKPNTRDITSRSSQPQNRAGDMLDSSGSQTRNHGVQKPSKHTLKEDQRGAEDAGQPGARQTKLFVRVHKNFHNVQAFVSFLDHTVGSEGYSVPKGHISFRLEFTFGTLVCTSENKASRIKQKLIEEKPKSEVQVDCSFKEFPKVERRQEQRNSKITKAMFRLDNIADKCIRKNQQKAESIQRHIAEERKKRKRLETFDTASQTIQQLEQEKQALQQQLEAFKSTTDQVKAQLQSVQSEDVAGEIKALQDRFERECDRLEAGLPIYGKRNEILQAIDKKPVTIILGETGSGKSTQLIQYLHESGSYRSGLLVCTQPRRVAASSLAKRVAKEMKTELGKVVGYQYGSKFKQSSSTRMLYMTDHCLLNECLKDPELRKYSCIIVDEAHERSLYTDLLLSMLKQCLAKRDDLKVVITSATIDPQMFQNFFTDCHILRVTGRAFPVDVVWCGDGDYNPEDDYCERAVQTVLEIHINQPGGDILVFVTSPAETEKCSQLLSQKLKDAKGAFKCFQLHGKQQPEEQEQVFKPLTRARKIVFATNCAETSLTIDGIKYVVDTGLAKEMCYDPRRNLNALRVTLISQSSANQRKGRAGRTAPGQCYRLFSQEVFKTMQEVSMPEILRTHLGQALLKLAELGVDQTSYDFVQSPTEESIRNAVEMLRNLGALKNDRITEKGLWMTRLPFDPRLGLLTYLGEQKNLLYDSIVLAAVMSAEGSGVFYRGTNEETQRIHDISKTKVSTKQGDCLLGLHMYRLWLAVPDREKGQWCQRNGLNAKALRGVKETIQEVCHVLKNHLASQDFSKEDQTEELRKMVVTCYAANLCHYLGRDNAGYFAVRDSCRVQIHPSSCLKALGSAPEWVVFDQLIQTSQDFMVNVTPVEESWIPSLDTAGPKFSVEDIRKKTVQKIFSKCVGCKAFYSVVGPRYSRLRELEASFSDPDSVVFIEANRDQGEISIYSTDQADQLKQEVETIINNADLAAGQENREVSVAGAQKQDVRVVLGSGGKVEQVLMPEQTRRVFIKDAVSDTTEEKVREKFGELGDIQYCHRFEKGNNWGFLVFKTSEQAERVARETKTHISLKGELERRNLPDSLTRFHVMLKWCRLRCQGYALVRVTERFFIKVLRLETLYVDTVPVTIDKDRQQQNHLRLHNISSAMTEDLIRRTLLHALDQPEETKDIVLDIHIPRSEPVLKKEEFTDVERQVKELFQPYVERSVDVYMTWPRPKDLMYTVNVYFSDPAEGFKAFEKVKDSVKILALVRRLTQRRPFDDDDEEDDDSEDGAEADRQEVGGPYFELLPRATAQIIIPRDVYHVKYQGETIQDLREEDLQATAQDLREEDLEGTAQDLQEEDLEGTAQDLQEEDLEGTAQDLQEEDLEATAQDLREEDLQATAQDLREEDSEGTAQNLAEKDIQDVINDLKDQNVTVSLDDDDDYHDTHHRRLIIRADRLDKVIQAKTRLGAALRGDVVDCRNAPLLCSEEGEGRDILRQMMEETQARVKADKRSRKVTIWGAPEARKKMRERIQDLLQAEKDSQIFCLRGEGKPAGLMKAVLLQYGDLLTGLIQATGLQNAVLNFRRHTLEAKGCPQSLEDTERLLKELTAEVERKNGDPERRKKEEEEMSSERSECPVCLSPIQSGHLYRLQLCAHAYCTDCFRRLVVAAIGNQLFPIECVKDGCQQPLALYDLLTLTRKAGLDLNELTKAAVSAFIKAHSNDYRNCPTQDCPAVYKVIPAPRQSSKFGQPLSRSSLPAHEVDAFVCPSCGVSTCRRCHTPSHTDRSCPTGSSKDKGDAELETWASEDSANRKKCPRCDSMIERIHGCSKMVCAACKVLFCFVCRQIFASSRECYDHLVKKHGGIFPPNYGLQNEAAGRPYRHRPLDRNLGGNDRGFDYLFRGRHFLH